jgi:hypothetical protein
MPSPHRLLASLLALLALTTAALTIAACGYESTESEVVEGEPVKLGDVKYNVVFSRFLNPNDTEDSAYLVGQPSPKPAASYFGVFFEVQNEGDEPRPLPDSFTITDAEEQTYESLTSESLYAFPLGGEVEEQEQVPVLDSTPQQGPIEGSLVLFELPETASENRPLTLDIVSPDGEATVDIDL